VLIVGGGKIGTPLASSLINDGHEVFVLDRDPSKVAALQHELGMITGVGDATSVRALRNAGAGRASVIIATTGTDEDNLAVCQLAKKNFSTPRTIAIAYSPENGHLFGLLQVKSDDEKADGKYVYAIDIIVSATDLIMSSLAAAVPAHPLIRLMPVADRQQEIVAMKLPAAGHLIGRIMSEVSLPYGVTVIFIVAADGTTKTPDADTVFEAEDEIIALSPTNATLELYELFTELR
jgi:trk system potassium uptake protein TrkA